MSSASLVAAFTIQQVPVADPFTSTEECQRILRVFRDCIQNKIPITTMTSPVQGATGFTFLCSMKTKEQNFACVLKWQSLDQARNEKLCTSIVQKYGFSTPRILIVDDEELSKDLARFAARKKPAMPSPEQGKEYPLALIAMNRFSASTFKEVIRKGEFFSLSSLDQERILTAFGKIIVFDMLIGNDDRIVRIEDNLSLETDQNNSVLFKKTPMMNYGNVMLEIHRGSLQAELRHIHFIDSASNRNLFKTTSVQEDETDLSCGNMFDDEDEELPATAAAPAIAPNLPVPDLKEKYEELFSRVFQKILTHPEIFAEHALVSISNAIEDITTELLDIRELWHGLLEERREPMKQALLSGMNEAIKTLIADQGRLINSLDILEGDQLKLIENNIKLLTSTGDQ